MVKYGVLFLWFGLFSTFQFPRLLYMVLRSVARNLKTSYQYAKNTWGDHDARIAFTVRSVAYSRSKHIPTCIQG